MKCPGCKTENPDTRKFCRECGSKLSVICSQCSSENLPGDKFCGECGQKLPIPAEPPPKDLSFDEKLEKIQRFLPKGLAGKILSQRNKIEGERKQVTVMFCDMEGFTALSERLGPEEVYSLMDQVYEILIHKVHDYDGTVNEMTGDGIMALFGAPIALEHAPQRAIRSAYAIHREMTKFSEKIKLGKGLSPIKMRIGIHTGPVVVGTLGNDLRVEFKAVGDTVNSASRMEGLAEPGTTYVTEDTFKLTEGLFRFEALGEHKVKGKEEPVRVYRVIAPSSRRTRFDVSAERGLTPIVGRNRELELLLDGFQRSKEGRGQAVSIVAEAGVGKSRLLYEFRKAIANEDVTFIEGRCLSYSRKVAYHPVIDTLKSNFDIREDDGDFQIREKVSKGLKVLGVDKASTLPYLLELLSVTDSGIDEISMSPEAKKDRIIEALRRIVLKGSEIRPLIMAFEDLHWIDKSSEDSLKDLLENISGARVFLIFAYRPEFVHTWGGRSYHSQMTLNRLSNRESLSMVSYLLGTEDIDKTLEELILKKTEGVPFFIEEFAKSLKDLRIIDKANNKYQLARDIREVVIPSTIQDVVMARVDSLPEGAKEVLQTGAIIEREFGYELIKEVADLPEQELLSRLSILKQSELLYERGIYPDSTYVFKHSLVQDAVYQSLLKITRQEYHRRIAHALEECFPQVCEAHPEFLGHHFTEAGLVELAVPYWQKAGEIATKRSANVEAIDYLNRCLELLKTLPETSIRAEQELPLLLALGVPLLATKGYAAPEVEQTYARARSLCQHIGETSQLFRVLMGLWAFYLVKAEYQTTRELAEQLLSQAKSIQDPALLLWAHSALGATLFYMGEFVRAHEHSVQGMAMYDRQQHRSLAFLYGGADPGTSCFSYGALSLWALGYPDQALDRSREMLNLAQELAHPLSLARGRVFAAWLHQFRREEAAVHEQAGAAISYSEEQRLPQALALGRIFQGWALAEGGQEDEGISQINKGLNAWQAMGGELGLTSYLVRLAEVYGKMNMVDEGLRLLAEALALVGKNGERAWEAELYRIKGELLLALSAENQGEAETCFLQAHDIARRQQAKSWELRSAMSMSRLWLQLGKRDAARKLLSEIYGWFKEGFDTGDLIEAKALLKDLS